MQDIKTEKSTVVRDKADSAKKAWTPPEVQEISVAYATLSAYSGTNDAITST